MKLGKCPACSKKIGSRSANGVFRWHRSDIKQMALEFAYPGRKQTTKYHIVLCKECGDKAPWETIEVGVRDEPNYRLFRNDAPTAYYVGREEDHIP